MSGDNGERRYPRIHEVDDDYLERIYGVYSNSTRYQVFRRDSPSPPPRPSRPPPTVDFGKYLHNSDDEEQFTASTTATSTATASATSTATSTSTATATACATDEGPSTSTEWPESALSRALRRIGELNLRRSEPLPTKLTLLDTDPEDVFGTTTTKEKEEHQQKVGDDEDDKKDKKKKKKERMKVVQGQEAIEKLKRIQFKQPSPFGCRADKEKLLEKFNWLEAE
jgi:hypothetical protein